MTLSSLAGTMEQRLEGLTTKLETVALYLFHIGHWTGMVQLWFDVQILIRKFVSSVSNITGPTKCI